MPLYLNEKGRIETEGKNEMKYRSCARPINKENVETANSDTNIIYL